jgi:hypothetical protein
MKAIYIIVGGLLLFSFIVPVKRVTVSLSIENFDMLQPSAGEVWCENVQTSSCTFHQGDININFGVGILRTN